MKVYKFLGEQVIIVDDLKNWLRSKLVTAETTVMAAPAAARNNALIGELLKEIEDILVDLETIPKAKR